MPTTTSNLGTLLGAEPQQNLAGGLSEGVKAGIQLATAADTIESDKMKVQEQKIELAQKQATAMLNRTKAAMFAQSPAAFDSIMKANKAYADSIGLPYNDEALKAAYKDPTLRLSAQREINRVMSGGQLENPQAIVDFFGSDSPAIFEQLQNASYQAGVKKQGQDFEMKKQAAQLASQERIAGMKIAEARLPNPKEARLTQKEFENDVERLSKSLSAHQLPAIAATLKSIDSSVGGLYTKDAPKKLNEIAGLKGFAASFKVPWTQVVPLENLVIDDKNMPLLQDVATLRNTYLNLQAGTNVTDNEAVRFLQQLGQGGIKNGEQLANGIRALNRGIKAQVQAVEAGYPEDIRSTYASRGGVTSASLPSEVIKQAQDPEIEKALQSLPKGADINKAREALMRAKAKAKKSGGM